MEDNSLIKDFRIFTKDWEFAPSPAWYNTHKPMGKLKPPVKSSRTNLRKDWE